MFRQGEQERSVENETWSSRGIAPQFIAPSETISIICP